MPPFFNIDDFVIRKDQRTEVRPTFFRILLENSYFISGQRNNSLMCINCFLTIMIMRGFDLLSFLSIPVLDNKLNPQNMFNL